MKKYLINLSLIIGLLLCLSGCSKEKEEGGKTADYIEKIIREGATVYFSGAMSEEKVAENIQNRIQLVLDER